MMQKKQVESQLGIIAILSSPSSFQKNDEMRKIRGVISKGSGIFHYEVEKHKDIAEALGRFRQANVDAIIILGDRALSSATFEHIIENQGLGCADIPLAILPAGDNNIVAENMGALHSAPHVALAHLLHKHQKGNLLDGVMEYPLIKLEGVRGIGYLYGLFFCAGEIVKQKRFFHRNVAGRGPLSRLRRWRDIISLVQKGYRGALRHDPLENAIRINRNQRGAVVGQFFMVLITTLGHSFRNVTLKPCGPGQAAHFISVENTTDAIIRTGKQMLRGNYDMADLAGHVISDIKHARIVLRAPFVLDGSYYQAADSGELFITVTDRLKFIKLS